MIEVAQRPRAPRNKTITLCDEEKAIYLAKLKHIQSPVTPQEIENCTVHQDLFQVLDYLPRSFVDLLFIDPPYNLTKSFNGRVFRRSSTGEYARWLNSWLQRLVKTLKPNASVYICGNWSSAAAVCEVAEHYLQVRNRITWEREKGRGAGRNWKDCSEDIFFCTASNHYTFNVDRVKLKRRVLAPYSYCDGEPKDWERTGMGDFRLTHPSNVWNDMTVPFWSMPENTDHPTQKPEKLLARILLASSNEGDLVLDPFLGSGTTSVVAKKLKRRYVGIEADETYCCLAEKRLLMAERDARIQGYAAGVFWERNTSSLQKRAECHPLSSETGRN